MIAYLLILYVGLTPIDIERLPTTLEYCEARALFEMDYNPEVTAAACVPIRMFDYGI